MTKNKGKNVGQLKDSQLLVTFFKCSTKTTQSTSFRQYHTNKRHSYGFLLKSLNDLRGFFTHKASPYVGKREQGDGPYYMYATEDYVKYLMR